MRSFETRANELIGDLLTHKIAVKPFCSRFEHLWNFEREPSEVTGPQAELYEQLFDAVTSFTEFEEDRKTNPRFTGPEPVFEMAKRVKEGTATN